MSGARDAAPRVVWHLGFHKTGTTSFQRLLEENATALTPVAAVFTKGPATIPYRRAAIRLMRPGKLTRLRWVRERRLRGAVRAIRDAAMAHRARVAVVSEEDVLGYRLLSRGVSVFDAAESVLRHTARAAAPAASHFVFYTRDFEAWLRSAWNQEVKVVRESRTYEAWRAALPFDGGWTAVAARLDRAAAEVGATVEVRDFAADAAEGLPLGGHVLRRCGMDDGAIAALRTPRRSNESLGTGALAFMLALNKSDIDDDALRAVRRIVMAHPEHFHHG